VAPKHVVYAMNKLMLERLFAVLTLGWLKKTIDNNVGLQVLYLITSQEYAIGPIV
jgi:hypothetical protein